MSKVGRRFGVAKRLDRIWSSGMGSAREHRDFPNASLFNV